MPAVGIKVARLASTCIASTSSAAKRALPKSKEAIEGCKNNGAGIGVAMDVGDTVGGGGAGDDDDDDEPGFTFNES